MQQRAAPDITDFRSRRPLPTIEPDSQKRVVMRNLPDFSIVVVRTRQKLKLGGMACRAALPGVRAGPPYEPPATPYGGQFMAACELYLRAGHVGESNCASFATRGTSVLLSAVNIEDAVTTLQ